jgi:hypothetical protein
MAEATQRRPRSTSPKPPRRQSQSPSKSSTPQTPEPRLFDDDQAAVYLGVSKSQLRNLVANRIVPRVNVPSGDGTPRSIRRLLLDRADLDRLIDSWKGSPPQLTRG